MHLLDAVGGTASLVGAGGGGSLATASRNAAMVAACFGPVAVAVGRRRLDGLSALADLWHKPQVSEKNSAGDLLASRLIAPVPDRRRPRGQRRSRIA